MIHLNSSRVILSPFYPGLHPNYLTNLCNFFYLSSAFILYSTILFSFFSLIMLFFSFLRNYSSVLGPMQHNPMAITPKSERIRTKKLIIATYKLTFKKGICSYSRIFVRLELFEITLFNILFSRLVSGVDIFWFFFFFLVSKPSRFWLTEYWLIVLPLLLNLLFRSPSPSLLVEEGEFRLLDRPL
jgi:hypothetical protein